MTGKGFGWALDQLELGLKVARQGWNGRGQYLIRWPGHPGGAPMDGPTAVRMGKRIGSMQVFEPWIMLHTTEGALIPWTASQSDVLKKDWIGA